MFAPVFQPLLGPIDRGAEALILERLEPEVPTEPNAQAAFFESDSAPSQRFVSERVRSLKRLLVQRAPRTPTGLLSLFCPRIREEGRAGTRRRACVGSTKIRRSCSNGSRCSDQGSVRVPESLRRAREA